MKERNGGGAEDIFMIQFALLAVYLVRAYYVDYKCTDNIERFTRITMFLLSTIKLHSILEKNCFHLHHISISCLDIFY